MLEGAPFPLVYKELLAGAAISLWLNPQNISLKKYLVCGVPLCVCKVLKGEGGRPKVTLDL